MTTWRTMAMSVLLVATGSAALADERDKKGVTISDRSFRQIATTFLNDPRHSSAPAWARLILLYMKQTSSAAVVLGSEELQWAGFGDDDRHLQVLLAAYAAGNIQSQLNSGVKRNDRYSGLLTLFHVYRTLREQDKKFQIAALDRLLEMHREDKLGAHLQKLEEKKPAKLTPAEVQALRKLMKPR
ncbi:MAG TPA: hypothetical protein VMG10_29245 [Gemmataceae bacterium]|nr:hypothetical protein [Gemmataceae bacterium]